MKIYLVSGLKNVKLPAKVYGDSIVFGWTGWCYVKGSICNQLSRGWPVSLRRHVHVWQQVIGDLLFPPRCSVCNGAGQEFSNGLCGGCAGKVVATGSPCCVICGRDFPGAEAHDHTCGECLRLPPAFSMARSLVYYDGPVRQLLHNLKYNFDTAAISPLLKIARGCDYSNFESADYFIPVPLHPRRLRKRGVSHAQVIAQLLFPGRKKEILVDTLVKHRDTPSQTSLDRSGRKVNLRGAFSIKHPEIIKNKKICLVDDVYTTGATVGECAKTIHKAGAAEVVVLVFARVRRGNAKKM